jgi:hypothetical protein
MKNIHLLPKDKPSRLRYNLSGALVLTQESYRDYSKLDNIHIYITNDDKIKEGDWVFYTLALGFCKTTVGSNGLEQEGIPAKKIILTTDGDLIKDGVQDIDDTFLEWFVKNPSCEFVKTYWNPLNSEYDFMIPKEEPKQTVEQYEQQGLEKYAYEFQQETLEEAAKRYSNIPVNRVIDTEERYYNPNIKSYDSFIEGAKWQAERMYTEEETLKFGEIMAWNIIGRPIAESSIKIILKQLFKQFKK